VGRYPVVYADPPWRFDIPLSAGRALENHYQTMSLEDICALQIPAAENAVLFLWVPSPMLPEGLRVMGAWGFRYSTCAVWDKKKIGMGRYFRQQHEQLFVCVRGKPGTPAPEARPSSVIRWPRGKHSAKPEKVYPMIEAMYPGPYLELFARPPFREGWDSWGNETYETSKQRFLFEPGNHIGMGFVSREAGQ
jgi:N6-adenosine-specific RNA methylase IME4